MTAHPSMSPETVQLVDQMSTLLATAGKVMTTHELTQLAPARVLTFPCDWGTCLPRGGGYGPALVAEWHDHVDRVHYLHVVRSSEEVGQVLSYLVAVGHLKLVTVTAVESRNQYKAWLWVGPVPVSADRLEQMWELTP